MEELLHNLGIKWQLLLAQTFNFFVLLFVLKKFLYKPMLKFLRERRALIDQGIKKSELAEKQFREFREMQAKDLAKTRAEAHKIIEKAKNHAEEARNQVLLETKNQTEALFARAEKDIDLLKKQKNLEAERELSMMAVQGMEYLIGEKTSDNKRAELAEAAIRHIKRGVS